MVAESVELGEPDQARAAVAAGCLWEGAATATVALQTLWLGGSAATAWEQSVLTAAAAAVRVAAVQLVSIDAQAEELRQLAQASAARESQREAMLIQEASPAACATTPAICTETKTTQRTQARRLPRTRQRQRMWLALKSARRGSCEERAAAEAAGVASVDAAAAAALLR